MQNISYLDILVIARTGGDSHRLFHFHGRLWPVLGAGLGLVGGTILPLVGIILMAIATIIGNQHSVIFNVGSALLPTIIPLLIWGGYCLDLIETDGSPSK